MVKCKQTVIFGGYAASGGSAIRDILKEFEGVAVFPTEFRVIKEHYGLLDLKAALFFSPSPEKTDLALKDFLWLCNNFARDHHKIFRSGHSYDEHTNKAFRIAVNRFISNIVDYTYPMSWHFYDFQKGYIEYTISRFLRRLSKKLTLEKPAYMSLVTEQAFDVIARRFLSDITAGIITQQNASSSIVGLHNALAVTSLASLDEGKNFFKQMKVIVVDRDPRDIFLDFPSKRYLPYNVDAIKRAKYFVKFFLKLREQQKSVNARVDVLPLSFERLVLDYDASLNAVKEFLGPDIGVHHKKMLYFNPEKSLQNIGKFKYLSGEDACAIKYIEKELSDFIS